MDTEGAMALGAALPSCKRLATFEIHESEFGSIEGLRAILAGVSRCPSLQSFCLGVCAESSRASCRWLSMI